MDEIVVRCRPKQFEILVIEVGLNIRNWVPISDELFVVLKRVVATSGEDHDSGHDWVEIISGEQIAGYNWFY